MPFQVNIVMQLPDSPATLSTLPAVPYYHRAVAQAIEHLARRSEVLAGSGYWYADRLDRVQVDDLRRLGIGAADVPVPPEAEGWSWTWGFGDERGWLKIVQLVEACERCQGLEMGGGVTAGHGEGHGKGDTGSDMTVID